MAGFVSALGLRRPHVLGHSFGGGLALELYRRHPAVPATLILAGAYAGWAGSLPRTEVERRLRFALHGSIPASRLVVMAGLGHESYVESPERFNAEVRSFLRSVA